MSQVFKKKVVVASVAAAFAFGAIGAMANQFEASVTDVPSGKYLYSGGGYSATGVAMSSVVTTEVGATTFSTGLFSVTIPASVALRTTAGAALAQTIPTGAANALAVRIDTITAAATVNFYIGSTSADAFMTGVADAVSATGVYFGAAGATCTAGAGCMQVGSYAATPLAVTAAGTQVGVIYKDATGNTVISFGGVAGSAVDTMKLVGLDLGPVSGQTGDVNISIADGDATGTYSAKLGVTATSVKVATESTALFKTSSAALPTVTQGTGKTPATATVRFMYPHATSYQSKKFALSLPTGCAYSTTPTVSSVGGQTATVSLASTSKAIVSLHASTDTTGGNDTFTISGAYLNTTSCSTGTVAMTISSDATDSDISTSNISNFTTVTADLISVTTAATTISFVDQDAGTNPGVNTLFTGRTTVNPQAVLRLAEAASGSITGGGVIDISLSNGAKWVSGVATQAVTSGATIGFTAYGTDGLTTKPGSNSTLTKLSSLVSASSTTPATLEYTMGADLNLSNATAGTLTATFAGSAGVSGTVDFATLVDATKMSVSAATPTVTAGDTVAIPEIVIVEQAAGAIASSEKVIINFPSGSKVQENGTDATGAMSNVTVKAFKADGTDITSTFFGAAKPVVTALDTDTTSTFNRVVVDSAVTANTANGKVTIKISGISVKPSSSSSAGDYSATIASHATKSTATASLDSATGLTKTTLKLASVVTASTPTIPAAVVTGTTTSQSITVSVVPSGNDNSKPGMMFVVGSIPGAGLFSLSKSGAWTMMNLKAPASTTGYWSTGLNTSTVYSVGNLTNTSAIPVLTNQNMTGLDGAVLYVGYGTNALDTDMAFTNMISNGTYRVACTVTSGVCK
jgi:hypothetical protein